MTPPLSKSGPTFAYPPTDINPANPGADLPNLSKGGPGVFAAKGGDDKPGADKAKGGSDKSVSPQELVPSLNDEALFGLYLSKYQPERNKRFLNVTLAIMAVKKYLGGDASELATAKEKIVAWLSDPALLPKDTPSHQARVNLIAVLDRAKDDAGVAEILKALRANYSTAAVQSPAPVVSAGKTADELTGDLDEKALLGEQYDAFQKGKNKKYLNLNLSLIAIRKFVKGDSDQLTSAKEKIAAWRSDASLLSDPVAVQFGKSLNAVFKTATQDKAIGDGFKEMRKVLVADYAPKEAGDAEKKVEVPGPVANVPVENKSAVANLSFNFANPGKTGARQDTIGNFTSKLGPAARIPYERVLKKYEDFTAKSSVIFTVDNATGYITNVRFEDIQAKGSAGAKDIEAMYKDIATRMFSVLSFEKSGSEKSQMVKLPLTLKH